VVRIAGELGATLVLGRQKARDAHSGLWGLWRVTTANLDEIAVVSAIPASLRADQCGQPASTDHEGRN
jgi:hypothetical protein